MKFSTDLHRVLGLGSAKEGVHHWIAQRITAIALIPLGLWFVYSFIVLAAAPYDYAQGWLASPINVTFSLALVFMMFYHGYLGMKVIFEDYITHYFLRWILIVFIKFLSMFLGLLAVISILRIFLN